MHIAKRWGAYLGLSLLLLGSSFLVVQARHGTWHDHYRGANAMPCCGQRDCTVTRARLISQSATQVTAEVEGILVTLPAAALHQSEDAQDWLCRAFAPDAPLTSQTIRCLFIAAGG